ncbi:SH3 domain-containing protein C23A1.17-like [Rosa sericea]
MPPPGRAAVATILAFCLLLLNNVSATEYTYIASQQVTAQDFLQAHNEVRAMFNEPMLTWDDKLADYAHQWAEKTSALGKCEERYHSYGPYGENLFWGWSWNDYFSPRDAVMMWTDEKNDFDVKSLKCTPGKMCGHFTQVMWRNSKRVGCSRIKCAQGGVLMICNYDPPGNWIDSKLGGLMNPFGEDKTTVPPVVQPKVPQAVPHVVQPKVPQPVPADGHPTVPQTVPPVGHQTVPHPVPADGHPTVPPVVQPKVPAVPHVVQPKVPQPVPADGHPTVPHPVPADGHPTVPHPVPADGHPTVPQTVPPVGHQTVPHPVPADGNPTVPHPVPADGHPTVPHPVPADGHPTVPHPVLADHQPAFSRPPPSGGELPKKGRGRNRWGQGRGGHHPGRAKPNQNRNHRNRNRNHHHLSPRQRYLNRIRRRQRDNRKLQSQQPLRAG